MKKYAINETHYIEVTQTENGYEAQFFEDGKRLGPPETWAKLEDILEEYGLD